MKRQRQILKVALALCSRGMSYSDFKTGAKAMQGKTCILGAFNQVCQNLSILV